MKKILASTIQIILVMFDLFLHISIKLKTLQKKMSESGE